MRYVDRDNFVKDLREFADFIEEHGVELPFGTYDFPIKIGSFVYDPKDAKRAAKGMHGAEKDWSSENYIDLRKNFGETIRLEFTIAKRTVCEKKVVGTEEVEEQVIPAYTKEIVEWDCKESLLAS